MGSGEEQRAQLMKCEANGLPRGNEEVRKHHEPRTWDCRSLESGGPRRAGLPGSVGGVSLTEDHLWTPNFNIGCFMFSVMMKFKHIQK